MKRELTHQWSAAPPRACRAAATQRRPQSEPTVGQTKPPNPRNSPNQKFVVSRPCPAPAPNQTEPNRPQGEGDVGPTSTRGRETGVPARPGEVEDGPREPPAPCPVSYALATRSQKAEITAPPVNNSVKLFCDFSLDQLIQLCFCAVWCALCCFRFSSRRTQAQRLLCPRGTTNSLQVPQRRATTQATIP